MTIPKLLNEIFLAASQQSTDQLLIVIEVWALIFFFVAIFPVLAIVVGYRARWVVILHALRRQFFIAYFREPGRQFKRKVYLSKEIKKDKGGLPYIEYKKGKDIGMYFLKDEGFFKTGFDLAIEFQVGNKDPIDVFSKDIKITGYSAEESRSAFNTNIAQQLLRVKINTYEILIITLVAIVVVVSMIGAIYSYEVSTALTQLNHNLCLLVQATNPKQVCS